MSRATLALMIVSLATLMCAPALAQDDSLDREARALFEAGREAFDRGRFESALDYFQRSYDLSHRPGLLYNIGSAADRLRRDDVALEAFRQFLVDAPPDDETREQVEARIAAIEEAIAERDAAEAAETGHDDGSGGETTPDETHGRAGGIDQGSPDASGGGPGALPWVLVGGGAALAIGGVVLLAVGLGDISTVESSAGKTWREIQPAYDRAPALTGIGIAGLIVGAAVAGVGVVLAVTSGGSTEVALGPGNVTVRGSF